MIGPFATKGVRKESGRRRKIFSLRKNLAKEKKH